MPSRSIPTSFSLLFVFGLLAAGLIALVGFAIDKAGDKDTSQALIASNQAAAETFERVQRGELPAELGPTSEADPALALLEQPVDVVVPDDDTGDGATASPGDLPDAGLDDAALLAGADPARGQELFFNNGCNICHGDTGGGGIGPTIAQTGLTLSQVVAQYRTPRAAMPPFDAGRVPDAGVADIYAWLQTLDLPETIVPGEGTP